MLIKNQKLREDFDTGKKINLDIGGGKINKNGFYSLDKLDLEGVDIVADLNEPLSLIPDNSVSYLSGNHVLEHIREFVELMKEIHRIVEPNGNIEIVVPHFSNVLGYSDPTHVRLFGIYSMFYFSPKENHPEIRQMPSYYTQEKFIVKSVKLEFYRSGKIDRVITPLLEMFVNRSFSTQDFYERRLASIFHARQIRYIMTPEKQNT